MKIVLSVLLKTRFLSWIRWFEMAWTLCFHSRAMFWSALWFMYNSNWYDIIRYDEAWFHVYNLKLYYQTNFIHFIYNVNFCSILANLIPFYSILLCTVQFRTNHLSFINSFNWIRCSFILHKLCSFCIIIFHISYYLTTESTWLIIKTS